MKKKIITRFVERVAEDRTPHDRVVTLNPELLF